MVLCMFSHISRLDLECYPSIYKLLAITMIALDDSLHSLHTIVDNFFDILHTMQTSHHACAGSGHFEGIELGEP